MKKKIKKPFDVEAAKGGARVETADGHSVRIICYNSKANYYPIVGLISYGCLERVATYDIRGRLLCNQTTKDDLVIVEEIETTKFNPGDWVIAKYKGELPLMITTVTFNGYKLQDLQGHTVNEYNWIVDADYRLWTLKDAKPGDVLVNILNFPFIYKGPTLFTGFPTAYCGFSEEGDFIVIKGDDIAVADERVKPATKEQRDRLFWEMKKAGYRWEAESLTLSEIPKRWPDDKEAIISGYFIEGESSKIVPVACGNSMENYNVFSNKELAKSALAMARISQIIANDIRYGGFITDGEWANNKLKKFTIRRINSRAVFNTSSYVYNLLAFHTAEQRQLFWEENERLVKDYLMLK